MEKPNDRKSLGMFVASMLIFGTVGVLRRYIPLPSALLACMLQKGIKPHLKLTAIAYGCIFILVLVYGFATGIDYSG